MNQGPICPGGEGATSSYASINCLLVTLLALCSFASPLSGARQGPSASAFDQVMDSLARVREFQEVVVSPDGSHVAWVESLPAKEGNPPRRSAICVAGSKGAVSSPRRITAGKGDAAFSEHSVAWSPDGRVAFLSDREKPGQLQLYMTAASGGPVHKLTNLTGFLATPAWSPDGKQIALLFTENAPRAAGPLVAATADSGVVGERSLNNASPWSIPSRGRPVSYRRRTCTFTNTTGRRTAAKSSRRPRTARGTTIGTSHSFTQSRSPRVRPNRF